MSILTFNYFMLMTSLLACAQPKKKSLQTSIHNNMQNAVIYDTATFGTGCFWCTEAVFQSLKGVQKVTSGYAGGNVVNPSYEQICTGTTGHAEVCQLIYDPTIISYDELLEVFWKIHDPTTLNKQGNDVGTQYRSA
ncbi:MAG TPA: peptide-methionine (S)-S-oxide reductase MsrA, partial [Chitinophagaceae bacterium]|nr:peptide-methionine (S)-S-oxide reductase MsrA [Chitinophagaceae bacterium]